MFALLISDKLKSCLPSGPLNYVLSLEANEWFGPARIAELADTYVSHHGEEETMRQVNSAHVIKDTEIRSVQSKGRFGRTSYMPVYHSDTGIYHAFAVGRRAILQNSVPRMRPKNR